jgi:hypothetical protein
VVSGDTFYSVLAFLKLLVEAKVQALVLGVSNVHILLILYPSTVGTLSNRLSKAISSGCSAENFHMDTLLLFFPLVLGSASNRNIASRSSGWRVLGELYRGREVVREGVPFGEF